MRKTQRTCEKCEKPIGKSYLKVDREVCSDPRASTKYYCLNCAPSYFNYEPLRTAVF